MYQNYALRCIGCVHAPTSPTRPLGRKICWCFNTYYDLFNHNLCSNYNLSALPTSTVQNYRQCIHRTGSPKWRAIRGWHGISRHFTITEFNGRFGKLLNSNGRKQSFPKFSSIITEFDGRFGKLLNGNGQKWRFPKLGLMIMKFNRRFGKWLNDNGWKRSFPKSGLMIREFNGDLENCLIVRHSLALLGLTGACWGVAAHYSTLPGHLVPLWHVT